MLVHIFIQTPVRTFYRGRLTLQGKVDPFGPFLGGTKFLSPLPDVQDEGGGGLSYERDGGSREVWEYLPGSVPTSNPRTTDHGFSHTRLRRVGNRVPPTHHRLTGVVTG